MRAPRLLAALVLAACALSVALPEAAWARELLVGVEAGALGVAIALGAGRWTTTALGVAERLLGVLAVIGVLLGAGGGRPAQVAGCVTVAVAVVALAG